MAGNRLTGWTPAANLRTLDASQVEAWTVLLLELDERINKKKS
jgi:hypothetical protein